MHLQLARIGYTRARVIRKVSAIHVAALEADSAKCTVTVQ